MLTFEELRTRLLDNLRFRVRNGELTERGLARMTGISQPHIHNIVKGVRALSPEMGDEILRALRMSLLDLVELSSPIRPDRLQAVPGYRFINMLDGYFGPCQPWPTTVSGSDRLLIQEVHASRMTNPIAGRTVEDVRMGALFSANDVVVLDQSLSARAEVDSDALYLVKQDGCGLIRRVRLTHSAVYIATEDTLHRPSTWIRVPTTTAPVPQVVRARVHFDLSEAQWRVQVA